MKDGFLKVGAMSPEVKLADPKENARRLAFAAKTCAERGIKVLVFPELSLTGYSVGDLLGQRTLLHGAECALSEYIADTAELDLISFVGLPVCAWDKIYNCAAAVCRGELLGLVAKENLPNYGEYSELRWFTPSPEENIEISFGGFTTLLGNKMIFVNESAPEVRISAELCEDLWVSVPPSCRHAEAGANLVVNLSASGEIASKEERRRALVSAHSSRIKAAYVHCEAAGGESTTDGVFAGHNLIYSLGARLAESLPFAEDTPAVSDVDIDVISHERAHVNTFKTGDGEGYDYIPFTLSVEETKFEKAPSKTPFLPRENSRQRTLRILEIQARGLAARVERSYSKKMVIGVSGGLDSTLSLLVCVRAADILKRPRKDIVAVTMPCFGTTVRTRTNAEKLSELLGADLRTVDIKASVAQHLSDIGHSGATDVTYENAQARERTQVLMDVANMESGLVVGTGDLSELVLGWATYNGDHMSNYATNASVPKTLIRRMVEDISANYREDGSADIAQVLDAILATPVSPELLPPDEGEISQCTEELVGPYELHDFFIYYTLRYGFTPRKVYRIAKAAFAGKYTDQVILGWLRAFVRRFFSQQFKRSCMPDGPKVGVISVSPRGDLKMPSDASCALWLSELEELR